MRDREIAALQIELELRGAEIVSSLPSNPGRALGEDGVFELRLAAGEMQVRTEVVELAAWK